MPARPILILETYPALSTMKISVHQEMQGYPDHNTVQAEEGTLPYVDSSFVPVLRQWPQIQQRVQAALPKVASPSIFLKLQGALRLQGLEYPAYHKQRTLSLTWRTDQEQGALF